MARKKVEPKQPSATDSPEVAEATVSSSGTDLLKHVNELLLESGIDLMGRTLVLETEFSEGIFGAVDTALTLLERDGDGPITIKLMSYGGSTHQACALLGRIRESKCEITIKGYGAIMSAAALILAGAKKRELSQYGWFMWHAGSIELPNDLIKAQEAMRQVSREDTKWCQYMGKFTGKPASYWKKLSQSGKDVYLTPEECLEYKIIDSVF